MGLCVCVSVKSNLTSGASVRPENSVTYSAGNGGQKICGDFSEAAAFTSNGVKSKLTSQYANQNWLTATSFGTAEASEVTQWRSSESKA